LRIRPRGKTSKMLLAVEEYIKENPGHRVVVYACNADYARSLERLFSLHMGKRMPQVNFKSDQLRDGRLSLSAQGIDKEFVDNSVWEAR